MPLSGTLTKAKIIDAVAESNGYTRKKSIETVETVLDLIKRSLESGEDVLISGFGKFCVKEKAKRKGRNPATGEDMTLKPRMMTWFHINGTNRIQWPVLELFPDTNLPIPTEYRIFVISGRR